MQLTAHRSDEGNGLLKKDRNPTTVIHSTFYYAVWKGTQNAGYSKLYSGFGQVAFSVVQRLRNKF